MSERDPLIPRHGGYRQLKSFQVASLIYDLTVRFCDRYVPERSRTHDQMVQAARSGASNIAEGSQASGTSSKTEMKLTSVARSSLEELRLDYEAFLRHRGLPLWDRDDPRREELVARRPVAEVDVAAWARDVRSGAVPGPSGRSGRSGRSGKPGCPSTQSTQSTESTRGAAPGYREIMANAAVTLITVTCFLLDRQLGSQSDAFLQGGGFTERMYRERRKRRGEP